MIHHTFSFLHGIGERLERRFWRSGILTWDDFIAAEGIEGLGPESKSLYDSQLTAHAKHLAQGDARHFARTMKRRDHWKLYEVFGGEAVCLDIETNGLRPEYGGYATVVGLYDGYDWTCLVKDENLTTDNLNRALSGYKCLITFYGAAFDVPFLQRCFPGVRFDIPHFDLCFAARRVGFNGGLKKLEVECGVCREEAVRGLNGYDAVKLWDRAERGSLEARNLLLVYNREDTRNLLALAGLLYRKLKVSTGIEQFVTCGIA
jgi:hypothetical protein